MRSDETVIEYYSRVGLAPAKMRTQWFGDGSYTSFYNRVSRVWIVQETALAREICVHCGSKDAMTVLSRPMRYTGSPLSFQVEAPYFNPGEDYMEKSKWPTSKRDELTKLKAVCALGTRPTGRQRPLLAALPVDNAF